jgi:hypothetical protein
VTTPGRCQDRVSGRYIPRAGLCKPAIEIDAALGDAAELVIVRTRNNASALRYISGDDVWTGIAT